MAVTPSHLVRQIRDSTLVTGAGAYLAANMVNATVPLFLLPVLTRYLAPAEYGEVAIFQVWVVLMGALCGLSVHGAANRKYYDYDDPDEGIGEFISACLVLLVASSAVLGLLVMSMSHWLSGVMGLSGKWLLVGVLFAFCNFLVQLRLGQWQVRTQAGTYGVFQVSRSVLDAALSLLLVIVFVFGVDGRLTARTTAVVIFGVFSLVLLYRNGLIKWVWRTELAKEALSFGVPLIPHVLGAFLLLTVDRAIVGMNLGMDAAGYYMVAAQVAMVLSLILQSINKAYIPWLYERLRRDVPAEKLAVVKVTYGYGVLLAMCVVFTFLFGKDLLVWIAGSSYAPAADLVAWLVLAQAMRGMYFMVTNYIFYAKRTGVVARITITVGLINVLLLVLMTKYFGLMGAAWAMCISMLVQWLMTWRTANRLVPMPWFGVAR